MDRLQLGMETGFLWARFDGDFDMAGWILLGHMVKVEFAQKSKKARLETEHVVLIDVTPQCFADNEVPCLHFT